jgi:hypothetical protein
VPNSASSLIAESSGLLLKGGEGGIFSVIYLPVNG